MEDAIALIEKIIEEHNTINQKLQNFEQVANDAEALAGFNKTKDLFMPGRLDSHKGLTELEQLMNTISQGIHDHFGREEGALVNVFSEHGDKKLSTGLHSLLLEHEDLRDRLTYTKQDVDQLMDGKLTTEIWQAQAQDMRAYISHTRKLFEVHAGIEQKLFHSLLTDLKQKAVEGSN